MILHCIAICLFSCLHHDDVSSREAEAMCQSYLYHKGLARCLEHSRWSIKMWSRGISGLLLKVFSLLLDSVLCSFTKYETQCPYLIECTLSLSLQSGPPPQLLSTALTMSLLLSCLCSWAPWHSTAMWPFQVGAGPPSGNIAGHQQSWYIACHGLISQGLCCLLHWILPPCQPPWLLDAVIISVPSQLLEGRDLISPIILRLPESFYHVPFFFFLNLYVAVKSKGSSIPGTWTWALVAES